MVKKRTDKITGIQTTGHEWDGIEELENRLPGWWKLVFYVSVLCAIVYAVLFPSVPSHKDFADGALDWSSRAVLEKDMEIVANLREVYFSKIKELPLEQIKQDEKLHNFAIVGGESVFSDNCAACHGEGGGGRPGGYPVLADDDWIWGGKLSDINQTIKYGIRNDHEDSRQGAMTRFGADGILTQKQIEVVADYVLTFSDPKKVNNLPKSEYLAGQSIYAEHCASCHGKEGKGGRAFGAPNLSDQVWLYGGARKEIIAQIHSPKLGVMPPWEKRLDPEIVKILTIYVHSLGGGE